MPPPRELGWEPDNTMPSDFCFNITNLGRNKQAFLLHVEGPPQGVYRYVGLDHGFTGPIFHTRKDGSTVRVADRLTLKPLDGGAPSDGVDG